MITTAATTSDPTLAIGVLLAVAAGLFSVAIHYYLRVTGAAERLLVKHTRKRLERSKRLLRVPRIGRVLWLADVIGVVGVRAFVVAYLGFLWFLVVPVFMSLGSIMLASSVISFR